MAKPATTPAAKRPKKRALTAAQLAARIVRDTKELAKKVAAQKPAPKKPTPVTAAKRAAATKPKPSK